MKIKVAISNDINNWNQVNYNFIYNRFDLDSLSNNNYLLKITDEFEEKFIPFFIDKHCATLGCWGSHLTIEIIKEIKEFIYLNFKDVCKIYIRRAIIENPPARLSRYKTNDYYIDLPKDKADIIDFINSRDRKNIKRHLNLIKDNFSSFAIRCLDKYSTNISYYVEWFFMQKMTSHGVVNNVSTSDWLIKEKITNCYALYFEDKLVALEFTCEQCEEIYFANRTYDLEFAKYSPGNVLTYLILNELINKGKTRVLMHGGNYSNKKMFNSIETTVYEYFDYKKTPKAIAINLLYYFCSLVRRCFFKLRRLLIVHLKNKK